MTDVVRLLLALQYGDSQAPGGAFAFSWGFEGLVADGRFARRDFLQFLEGQLVHRWAGFDRAIVARAHALNDVGELIELDATVDAWLPVETQRVGSGRAGRALLGFHRRLGTPGASTLHGAVAADRAIGHLPVVQGAVFHGAGADLVTALTLSAYGVLSGLAGAALRLGQIDHVDAQLAIKGLRPMIASLLAEPVPPIESLHGFTPLCDIAMLRSNERHVKLFST